MLQPGKRNVGKAKSTSLCSDIGSLRLKIYYTRDYVFDSNMYDDLRKLILHSVSMQVSTEIFNYFMRRALSENVITWAILLMLTNNKKYDEHGKINISHLPYQQPYWKILVQQK